MALEKYKDLYTFSNELLKEEHARFNRIDEKASRYLLVITLLVGIVGASGKNVLVGLVPPQTLMQWLLLNLAVLSFFMLVATWFVIFRTLRIHFIKSPPLNQEMLDFFNNEKEINIYYHIAKQNSIAWNENRQVTDRKARALFQGYRMIVCTVSIFVIFICLFFVQMWNIVPVAMENEKNQQILTNTPPKLENKPSPAPVETSPKGTAQSTIQPDQDIIAPQYIVMANERQEGEL